MCLKIIQDLVWKQLLGISRVSVFHLEMPLTFNYQKLSVYVPPVEGLYPKRSTSHQMYNSTLPPTDFASLTPMPLTIVQRLFPWVLKVIYYYFDWKLAVNKSLSGHLPWFFYPTWSSKSELNSPKGHVNHKRQYT